MQAFEFEIDAEKTLLKFYHNIVNCIQSIWKF